MRRLDGILALREVEDVAIATKGPSTRSPGAQRSERRHPRSKTTERSLLCRAITDGATDVYPPRTDVPFGRAWLRSVSDFLCARSVRRGQAQIGS